TSVLYLNSSFQLPHPLSCTLHIFPLLYPPLSLSLCLTGLVQRCVIIQKDENGFGLTVSGDNPVFVQLVKEDGAAMRAGVQTGDRIIKVNGTLVTHSNHVEVVKLIKSGSYVALTVLGRPPGLPQIPLSDGEGEEGPLFSLTSPHSPGPIGPDRSSSSPSPSERKPTPLDMGMIRATVMFDKLQAMTEEHSRNPTPKLLKEIQDAKKHIPQHQEQLSKPSGTGQDSQSSVGSPSTRPVAHIIGAEDEDFDTEQEQMNGQCSCFQSVDILKSRPAHLAAFIHHVVSQFDPAPLLCYLYAELYKQTSSKETRRILMDTFFIEKTASLKVTVPESIIADLERKRPEPISEDVHRQYVQQLQDTLLPDIQKNLEDFRHKRSMGLTLAEAELARLDTERMRDRVALEKERSCAEHIISKIEDYFFSHTVILFHSSTMQFVILSYMKQLGVKVKESRGLEHKPKLMNLFPKIKKSIKPEKDGSEEKSKKTRFPSVFPQRRPSRIDTSATLISKAFHFLTHCLSLAVDLGGLPSSALPRLGDGVVPGDLQDSSSSNTHFDFSPCTLELILIKSLFHTAHNPDLSNHILQLEPPNWQTLVSRDVLSTLTPQEIKRQEVINELFYTERAHVRMMKVLENLFYQPLIREAILPPADIKNIFSNLEEIVQLHMSLTEQMTAVRKKNETALIDSIGDDLLSWFSGEEEAKIKRAAGTYCSNQPFALELIKSKQKKDQRFNSFIQEAESNRHCRRLQLKDIIPVETQRLTKYPLLLENIAKYTEDPEERSKVKKAGECCRKILTHVNQEVKEAENKQRLEDYQRRLDLSSLKQSENPMIAEFKNLDLTKRKMVHEGPLSWKVNKDKTIELYTLLLEDILVLLQRQDEKLILKCHSKNLAGTAETKHIFSPIIKLSTVMVRSVATDNRSFFVLSMSDNGAQIYELMAQTVSEQKTRVVCIFRFGLHFTLHLHFNLNLAASCNHSSCFVSVSAGSYVVLEVYGGSGESSTDDVQGSSGEPVAVGDSGIDLKKLLSSSSQSSGGPNLNRQIMTHIRLLQANLQHLKVTCFFLKNGQIGKYTMTKKYLNVFNASVLLI
uniref:Rho guanine nucleotide exchange factor 12-like n=1 Tax=Sinocyclocheilus anshuiensis TaxID=1608454 RepID=A0A671QAP0_9TELE